MKTPEGKERAHAEVGTHPMVCVGLVDLGTQPAYDPKYKPQRQLKWGWEISGSSDEEGNPIVEWQTFGFSNKGKNLIKMLGTWGHPEFIDEVPDALGKFAMGTFVDETSKAGKVFRNLAVVAPYKGKPLKNRESLQCFMLDPDQPFDEAAFKDLPNWMQEAIAKSPEYAELKEAAESAKNKGGKKVSTSAKAAVKKK